MKVLSDFGERLTELMSERGVCGLEIERVCGCKNQSVSVWLNRGVLPKAENLIKLSEYFNCSVDYLLGLSDEVGMSKNKPISFLCRLEEILKNRKISNYKLAMDCGFNRANISKWKKRNLIAQTECLITMSKYLDCSVEYLLGISND